MSQTSGRECSADRVAGLVVGGALRITRRIRSSGHCVRGRGLGSLMMKEAEKIASQRSPVVGIGFGLHRGYGVAQQLYVRRGYVPDGRGVYWSGRFPAEMEGIVLDNDLVLYLTKRLR